MEILKLYVVAKNAWMAIFRIVASVLNSLNNAWFILKTKVAARYVVLDTIFQPILNHVFN